MNGDEPFLRSNKISDTVHILVESLNSRQTLLITTATFRIKPTLPLQPRLKEGVDFTSVLCYFNLFILIFFGIFMTMRMVSVCQTPWVVYPMVTGEQTHRYGREIYVAIRG